MNKNKRDGIIGTVLFHGILVCLLLFLAFRTPLPLPEEEGMEVNLGYSETGFGDIQEETDVNKFSPSQPKVDTKNDIQEFVDDESVKLKENPSKKDRPKVENNDKLKQQPEQPKVNPNALYTKNNTKTNSQGVAGGSGDQGKPDGDPNAPGYDGNGGRGNNPIGNGIGFELTNRKAKKLTQPKYDSNDQGKVVVEIIVDKSGKVISAKSGVRGTTISDQRLWKRCEDAALNSLFSANQEATEQQVGKITYNFIKMN